MMATTEESNSRPLLEEDPMRDRAQQTSAFESSTVQSGAEALVALFKQVDQPMPRGVDVGTSPSPLSFAGSLSAGSRASSLVPDEYAQGEPPEGIRSSVLASAIQSPPSHPGARLAPVPEAAPRAIAQALIGEDPPLQKLLSQKISGTGTFFLLRDDSDQGPRVAHVGEWSRLGEEERGERVKQAYVAAEAICQALVPNESMDLLDALMETTDVYRSRYGYRKQGVGGEASLGAMGGGEREEEDSVPTLPNPVSDAEDILQLTPSFPGVGTVCLHRDKNTRKRRSEFVRLARSQRARVVKTAYEVVLAVAETFCPTEERMALLDRVFELHHSLTGRVHKKVSAALAGGYVDLGGLGLEQQQQEAAHTHATGGAMQHNAGATPGAEKGREETGGDPARENTRKRPPPTPGLYAEGGRGAGAGEEDEDGTHGPGSSSSSSAAHKHFKPPELTYPTMNPFAAQLMAAHWAVAMSNSHHLPYHPSGPSAPSLLPPGVPFASPLYQHQLMMAAAAASGNPYFYPHTQLGAPSTSNGVSPSSGGWPPMAASDGEGNDQYATGLDDGCSPFESGMGGGEGDGGLQEGAGEGRGGAQHVNGGGKMDAREV